jgi:hypothetical protein
MNKIRKFTLILMLWVSFAPVGLLMAQVSIKPALNKDTLNVSRDSIVQLIRIKDSLLHLMKHDSINMSNLISKLEFYRDSLNSALNQSIYRQKVDSAERMRRFLSYREFNRRSRLDLYNPIGIIDKDSIRSSMKEVVDIVFEDTSYTPRPQVLRSTMEKLLYHLSNDSVYFRIVNSSQDTIPFVLKKNRTDSTAFFVTNSKKDSAKLYMRSLDKNTLYMWVGDDLNLKHLLKNKGALDSIKIKWRDPYSLRIARRVVPVQVPKPWYFRSQLALMINQNTLVNWVRGGNSNIAFTSDIKAVANYAKGNISWTNNFWFVYGIQKTELLTLRKSADHMNIVSNLSHKAFRNFDYTLGMTFDTQGFKGFAYPNDSIPVSKFMAPADLKINLGLTYRPNPKLTINMSPITGQMRFVLDTALIDQTKYGLRKDQRVNAQIGPRVTINHSTVLLKNVNMTNYLELFTNYIDHPEKVNFDWRLSLTLKVNKYISTTINTWMIYDNRSLIPIYEVRDGKKVKIGEGKRIQFNEFLGITFTYIM